MAKAAAIWSNHFQNLTLLVLLSCLLSTVQADTHILSCNFTVKTGSNSRESTPLCSVDRVPLYPYDNGSTRKEGNAPKECADLFFKLTDIGEELRNQLFTMEEEGDLTKGEHSLLVTLVSLYKEGQLIDAYCNFTLDGQYPFSFNLKNKKLAVPHNNTPGIDRWQNNTELAKHLKAFLIGDSGRCLKKLSLLWEKMPRSTSRTPDIGNGTSPSQLPSTMNTTQLPSTKQLPSKEGSSITELVISIVSLIIIIIIFAIVLLVRGKSHPQGGEKCYKLCILDSCICGNRRGQHTPSAVSEPRPEESICMTVMSPLEGDSPCRSPASSVI